MSARQPTYWPTDPRKSPDLIDFGITKNIDRDALSAEISYDLCSDHSAIIVTYSGQTAISKTNNLYPQDWLKYKKYISSHLELSPTLDDGENCVDDIRLSKKSCGISASLSLQARSSSCIRRIGSR